MSDNSQKSEVKQSAALHGRKLQAIKEVDDEYNATQSHTKPVAKKNNNKVKSNR